MIRTSVDPNNLISAVRGRVRELDGTAVVYSLQPMYERVAQQLARSRFVTWLMAVFAAVALGLAMIGIYGVMTHSVAQRTQEIGIRMALGAGRRDVFGMITRQALVLVCAGAGAGLIAALALTRLIKALLFDMVSATDPIVFVGVTALLIFTAMVATWIPVRRATRVDPLVALRYE